jgi:hypothetical protein
MSILERRVVAGGDVRGSSWKVSIERVYVWQVEAG